jgi:hypothetical protein
VSGQTPYFKFYFWPVATAPGSDIPIATCSLLFVQGLGGLLQERPVTVSDTGGSTSKVSDDIEEMTELFAG